MLNSTSPVIRIRGWLCGLGVAACLANTCLSQTTRIPLPAVEIDGQAAKVHTQGLFVTEDHYLVTGRLETRPKRAFLFRFSRKSPAEYEAAELTPPDQNGAVLDHPGGFDRDKNGVYWIPVSTSNRRGPTIIYGLTIAADRPLTEAITIHHSILVDDHLGALCCLENGELLVANWDTETIRWLKMAGKESKVRKQLARNQFIANDPDWFLAVQDWKYDRQRKLVVAGGIDKSPKAKKQAAVLSEINLRKQSVDSLKILPAMEGVARPLTNEGMALHGGDVFLLPEDLGRGAKILRLPSESKTR